MTTQAALMINTRVLGGVEALYAEPGATLTPRALVDLLVFLEAIALSDGLVIDGTTPAREREPAERLADSLESRLGAAAKVARPRALRPQTDEATLRLCRAAARQSMPSLRGQLDAFLAADDPAAALAGTVQPLAADRDPCSFADKLTAAGPGDEDRTAHALACVRDNFLGAKCVAGLLTADVVDPDEDAIDIAPFERLRRDAQAAARASDDTRLRWLAPMLMNAFRSNYLNALGRDMAGAALFGAPEIEALKQRQALRLGAMVAQKLVEAGAPKALAQLGLDGVFQTKRQFPFFGLFCLLRAEPGEPFSPIAQALAERDEILARFFRERERASETSAPQWPSDLSPAALAELEQARREAALAGLDAEIRLHEFAQRASVRFRIPQVIDALSNFSGAALGLIDRFNAADGVLGGVSYDVQDPGQSVEFTAAFPVLLERALLGSGARAYATFTHNIHNRLSEALADQDLSRAIAAKTRSVLGRELSPR